MTVLAVQDGSSTTHEIAPENAKQKGLSGNSAFSGHFVCRAAEVDLKYNIVGINQHDQVILRKILRQLMCRSEFYAGLARACQGITDGPAEHVSVYLA